MRDNKEGTQKAGWVVRPQGKCDNEWRRVEGNLGGRVLDLVQSKVGLSRPLGALEPLGLQRCPVTPGLSWKSLALLYSIFLRSYLFHTFPTAGHEYLGFLPSSLVVQMVKNMSAMQETRVHWLGRSLGEGNGNPLQCYSCLENSMDREAWWAAVHRVTKSGTRLSN